MSNKLVYDAFWVNCDTGEAGTFIVEAWDVCEALKVAVEKLYPQKWHKLEVVLPSNTQERGEICVKTAEQTGRD